jgi:Double-GTPase 1
MRGHVIFAAMASDPHQSMEANAQRVLVVGLPETGKSSFIQALDEVLKHPATPHALCSSGLAHDRSYIQSGKAEFLAGEKLDRTKRPLDDTSVELWFEHPPTGRRGRLHLPDKKGEIFRDQWVNRQWDTDYRESLAGIAGAFIFVRADEKARNDERLGILAQEARQSGNATQPWDMKNASSQVQLVDVLQFIAEHSDVPQPLRVAVLISAWDTIGQKGDLRPREPAKFLEREWALLAQYLRANPRSFTEKIFGVSAYGGPPGELGPLAKQPPHERSRLTEGTETTRDLTHPLRWLLELD